jgi:hypothetical protein
MTELDGQHLFFIGSDKATFSEKYAKNVYYNTAFLGNIDAAYEIFNVYQKRVEDRVSWIFEELKKDVDLAAAEALVKLGDEFFSSRHPYFSLRLESISEARLNVPPLTPPLALRPDAAMMRAPVWLHAKRSASPSSPFSSSPFWPWGWVFSTVCPVWIAARCTPTRPS